MFAATAAEGIPARLRPLPRRVTHVQRALGDSTGVSAGRRVLPQGVSALT